MTLNWLKPKLPAMGITRVANVTGLDRIGIPVINCIRPNSKHLSVSQGKGVRLGDAKVSAIMEAVEGFHFENAAAPVSTGSFDDISQERQAVNPTCFLNRQFACPQITSTPLDWAEATHALTGEVHAIPHALTYMDMTRARNEYHYFNVTSNGLAAGNTFTEAVSHALLEVIERDALVRWQSADNGLKKKTQLNLDTVTDEIILSLLAQLKQANIHVKLWLVSSSINIPVFHCAIIEDESIGNLGVFTGTGAHVHKNIAICRAITEAVQSRLTFISGIRDDIFPNYYARASFAKKPASAVDKSPGLLSYDDVHEISFSKLDAALEYLFTELSHNGYKAIYQVNHTKPDIDIPVAQVFVPGLLFNPVRM